jgi:cell shape-determining protein MreD
MNWLGFAVLAWVALGLELGLKPALRLGAPGIAPSVTAILAAVLLLQAPRKAAIACAAVLGLLMDLTFALPISGAEAGRGSHVVGPYVLGYLAAAQMALAMRGALVKRNPVTAGFVAMVVSLVSGMVVWIVLTLRARWLDPLAWDAWPQLWTRLAAPFVTGAVGVVVAFALLPIVRWLGMDEQVRPVVIGGRAAKY